MSIKEYLKNEINKIINMKDALKQQEAEGKLVDILVNYFRGKK